MHQSLKQIVTSTWYWLVPAIALVMLALLQFTENNESLFLFLNSAFYSRYESFWLNITLFGDAAIAAILLLPLLNRRPDIVWAAIIAGIITAVLVNSGKNYFALPRPPLVLDASSFHQIGNLFTTKSFPSGHTAAAFSVAAVVILSIQQTRIKIIVLFAALLVGISRIAIGAHWPMDVLAGAFIGWLPSAIGVMLAQKKVFELKYMIVLPIFLLLSVAYYLVFVHQRGDVEARFLEVTVPVLSLLLALLGFIKKIKNDRAKSN
ncbi:hypothetical protein MNBD_GAMMA22-2563 [hydrothermal vent metagenome]|uniref:Phosphatidic acid phosphatase type 2/haloperoxidase domain-containing protein n=1 Tax=hydrothermal vent metagenome TaxID=652676 RepID=A0A3B1A5Y4_9ZZZZ